MKYLALVLACPGLALAGVEVGVGVSHFSHQPDGFWYQKEAGPYDLTLNSPSVSLGWRQAIHPNWAVRIGYEYLGQVKSSAVATASDLNYEAFRQGKEPLWRLSHWYGKGDVQGVYFTLQPQRTFGDYTLYGELGGYAYKPTWQVTIPDWIGTATDTPHLLVATHNPRWQYHVFWGYGVSRGPWALAYTGRKITASGDEFPAVYTSTTNNLSLRYSF